MFGDDKVTSCLRRPITFLRISSSSITTSDAHLWVCVSRDEIILKMKQMLNLQLYGTPISVCDQECRLESECQRDLWVLLPVYFCPVTGPWLKPDTTEASCFNGCRSLKWRASSRKSFTSQREKTVKHQRRSRWSKGPAGACRIYKNVFMPLPTVIFACMEKTFSWSSNCKHHNSVVK